MLLREGPQFPEVLMARRHAGTAFGDSYVFPGGVLDPGDAEVHGRCRDVTPQHANASLKLEANGLDYFSAAVRELFEEAGILLARDAAGRWAFAGEEPVASGLRRQLNDGSLGWQQLLDDHDLRLACGNLHYFAHWVTPRSEPKRFSTRFFTAVLPRGQTAVHDGGELTDSRWMTAEGVLQAQRDGDMKLIYPTYATLKEIARLSDVEQVIGWARQRSNAGIARVRPAIVEVNGRDKVVLPGDSRYPGERGH